MSEFERKHLQRAVALAQEALEAGDDAFGSVLVGSRGEVLAEARNRVHTLEATAHPELTLARWAATHLTPRERAAATVYTSGEHCPMCAAAHGWVGLGPIVYASSSEQLTGWLREWGVAPTPVAILPIRAILPNAVVSGPYDDLAAAVRGLHSKRWGPPRKP